MLKRIAIVFLILFLGFCAWASLSNVNLRNMAIFHGRMDLMMAMKDYVEHGYVTNYGARRYQVWLSTNEVDIRGTRYECFITTTNDGFDNAGALAMTTNQVFIWLDSKWPPKNISTNYRAPMFPPRF
jgi:hypothetical protein